MFKKENVDLFFKTYSGYNVTSSEGFLTWAWVARDDVLSNLEDPNFEQLLYEIEYTIHIEQKFRNAEVQDGVLDWLTSNKEDLKTTLQESLQSYPLRKVS